MARLGDELAALLNENLRSTPESSGHSPRDAPSLIAPPRERPEADSNPTARSEVRPETKVNHRGGSARSPAQVIFSVASWAGLMVGLGAAAALAAAYSLYVMTSRYVDPGAASAIIAIAFALLVTLMVAAKKA